MSIYRRDELLVVNAHHNVNNTAIKLLKYCYNILIPNLNKDT